MIHEDLEDMYFERFAESSIIISETDILVFKQNLEGQLMKIEASRAHH